MLPLTCMAFNESDISENFGILTCAEIRNFMTSRKVNRLVGQNFRELFLFVGEITPKMTVFIHLFLTYYSEKSLFSIHSKKILINKRSKRIKAFL